MERFVGIIGIIVIFGICYLMSNNRKAINYKTIGMGFVLQIALALFALFIFTKLAPDGKLTSFTSYLGAVSPVHLILSIVTVSFAPT